MKTKIFLITLWGVIIPGILCFSSCHTTKKQVEENDVFTGLTLIPPSPVSDKILLDVRAGLTNNTDKQIKQVKATFYLDKIDEGNIIYEQTVNLDPYSGTLIKFPWKTSGHEGAHKIILEILNNEQKYVREREIEILNSSTRSINEIDGAFLGFYHWSEDEGKYWNSEIKKMTDAQWGELMDAQNNLGMNIVVIQEVYRNPTQYASEHNIEQEGYKGVPYYPSGLYPGRVDIAANDPLEAVLAQADKNGMNVFVGLGMYAWFDFSRGSLEWHKKLADEIWEKYGRHSSFYGWYISEEQDGGLGTEEDRENIVAFFKDIKRHVQKFAPDKPVMLATNSHNLRGTEDTYRLLLRDLDILCPFGFHRMPSTDLTGEEAAIKLQQLCDEAGSHLWMDMEIFEFAEKNALVPRSIKGLLEDLHRFKNFEKIICYQFPGLLNSPEMSIKPGGENTVKLYIDYKNYYDSIKTISDGK
jgi:hypothetical protein